MITGWSFIPMRSRSSFPSFEKGEVFTVDVFETWINCKRERGSTRSGCSPIHTNPSSITTPEAETRNRIFLPSFQFLP